MTIDERIMSERKKAENWKSFHKKCDFNTECNECEMCCEKEEKEHEQIAEWLEELKEMWNNQGYVSDFWYLQGYNKAIDEVIMQLDAEVESSAKFIREYDDSIAQKAYYSGLCHAKKIAEQLKEGDSDGSQRTDT